LALNQLTSLQILKLNSELQFSHLQVIVNSRGTGTLSLLLLRGETRPWGASSIPLQPRSMASQSGNDRDNKLETFLPSDYFRMSQFRTRIEAIFGASWTFLPKEVPGFKSNRQNG
jgi:hypothetical protein